MIASRIGRPRPLSFAMSAMCSAKVSKMSPTIRELLARGSIALLAEMFSSRNMLFFCASVSAMGRSVLLVLMG